MTKNPEIEMLTQLATIRQSLVEERDSLLARAAEIDAALSATPAPALASPSKPAPKAMKAAKEPGLPRIGLKDRVLAAVTANPGATIKYIQEMIPDSPASSVDSVVHSLVGTGQLNKDTSTPRKFTLAAAAPVAEVKKSNGKSAGAAVANGA